MTGDLRCQNCGGEIPARPPSQMVTRRGEPRRFCSDSCARELRGALYRRACLDRGLLTVAQVAELLGVSEHRVSDHRKAGALSAVPIRAEGMLRTCYGYRAADVQQFMASRTPRKRGPQSAESTLVAAGELGSHLAAAYCHVSYPKLMADRRAGKLNATEHRIAGIWRPVYGFKEAELDAYQRREAKRTDHWHRRTTDPELAAKISLARGGDGLAAASRAQARAADLGKRRGGRRRASARAELWAAMLDDAHERAALGVLETAPSLRHLCEVVALEHYETHPDQWEYNPEDALKAAGARVYMAVKALQKPARQSSGPSISF